MALFALRDAARLARPSALGGALLLEGERCIAIFDKYPKAKYHILILPRIGYFASKGWTERELDSVGSVLRHPRRGEVVAAMAEMAWEVVEMVEDEMSKTEGFTWDVNVGFHAVPSMRHVHLHVVSGDLVAPALKTKRHYNSFRPELGFFLPLKEVEGWVSEGGGVAELEAETLPEKERLLSTPLACYICGEGMPNMPELKRHLEIEFKRAAARGHANAKGKEAVPR